MLKAIIFSSGTLVFAFHIEDKTSRYYFQYFSKRKHGREADKRAVNRRMLADFGKTIYPVTARDTF